MNVHYIASISITGSSGKSKATREKIKALDVLTNCSSFTLDDLPAAFRISKLLSFFTIEFFYILNAIKSPKRADLIISRSLLGFGSFLVARVFNIPFVVEVHADFYDEAKILFPNDRVKLILARLLNSYLICIAKNADGIIFNNAALQEFYKKKYRILTPNIAIHNGCDTDFFCPCDQRSSIKRLGLNPKKKYLVFVGSVSKWHGVEYLLEIMGFLDSPSVELLVVGGSSASYLNMLKKQYAYLNNTRFVGYVETSIARDYINASSACLLPVNNIRVSPGSPLKLFDYAACGKPIITQSETPGYSDIVEKYSLGIVCDLTNAETAAQEIKIFLSNDGNRYEYNNRHCAIKYLSWKVVAKRWISFCKNLSAAHVGTSHT